MTFCHGGRRNVMKKNIHPKTMKTAVTCSCGNAFEVTSNVKELQVETCNACHPFYTGVQGNVSKTGRVDKFNRKYGLKEEAK